MGLSALLPPGSPLTNLVNTGKPGATTGSGSSSSADSQSATAAITSQLGPTAFLQLLTTQLSNQDPLNPMDDTQSVSQLAQFSALQASTNLEQDFANFQSNFAVLQSSSLIGKTVSVNTGNQTDANGNTTTGSTVTGKIQAVQVVNGSPLFTMVGPNGQQVVDSNGKPIQFTTSQITGIGG
jgi:flagellar basal-body rod modification protein FlgD